MITTDMIDNELAEEIATECSGDLTPYKVKAVLAWLANNPIEPTEEQVEELRAGFYGQTGNGTIKFGAKEFQRIAYLKKEEPIPQKLKDIYAEHGFCSADVMDAIQKAYKFGKESK